MGAGLGCRIPINLLTRLIAWEIGENFGHVLALPSLRPWENLSAGRHARAEAAVVNTINRVAGKHLRIGALHELFAVERVYLNTFAELDAYSVRPKSGGDYGGALFEPDTGIPAEWSSGAGKKVFAYLQPGMPGFAAMLKQLDVSPLRTLVAAPGLPRQTVRGTGNLRIVNQMVSFKSAFAQCDAVLSYGGHGMVFADGSAREVAEYRLVQDETSEIAVLPELSLGGRVVDSPYVLDLINLSS